MFGRRKIAMLVAEFLGTGILTLVFLSVQRSTIGVPYFIALAAGLTALVAYFVVSENSGAHLNPAVTLALWTARKVNTLTGALYIVMQLLGAWAAYYLYVYFANLPTGFQAIGSHYTGRVMLAEAVGTFVLALAWAAVAYRRYSVGNSAAVIGIAYALGIILASVAGIGIINPAVALGTRAWTLWGSMGWGTYVLGPVLGAIVGVNLFGLLFAPKAALAVAKVATPKARTTRKKATTRRKR
ncbi:MAG TPA: aquaporin [Candidatus Dormibacteraeota bacterium]|nr:aquaporin [Candidatus Dormibacteraeota bacterium]